MEAKKLVEIRNSAINGHGTFAKENIPRGSYITTLSGEPFNKRDIDAVCELHKITNDDPLQIDEHTMLVLDHASKTINHSCSPNSGMRNKCDLYAIEDIKVGEEITYDYSTTVGSEDVAWCMKCACGATNCRKNVRYVLSIPRITLIRYAHLNALPDFIRKQLGF